MFTVEKLFNRFKCSSYKNTNRKCLSGPRNLKKGESGLSLTPVLTLWGSGHIARHVWRWVIVPSDLTRSFSAICAHYCYSVIHHTIDSLLHAWFEFTWERQDTLLLQRDLPHDSLMRAWFEFTWERQVMLNEIIWLA